MRLRGLAEGASWQAQYFVRVGRADVQIFVVGAKSRGAGDCRCGIGIAFERVWFGGDDITY